MANKTSYIQHSYIGALESAGARTVPLIYDNPNVEEELAKLDHLNGVFYCGGDGGAEYLAFGRKIFNKAKQLNDAGKYLPVWGTCLGFQYLSVYAASAGEAVLSEGIFDSDDANYPLQFLIDPMDTKLFSPLGHAAQMYA